MRCGEMIKEGNKWLDVKGYLTNKNFNILLASLKNHKEVIIKFGHLKKIQKEYEFGKLAYENGIPNFIKFICTFSCNDSISDIQSRNFRIHNFICKGEGDQLGMIIMPYVPLGNLDGYVWNINNLHVLKNVLCQIVFSLLYAYEKFQFVHGDLHPANILLRRSKKKQMVYGDTSLDILGLYPIVMDFERSYQAENKFSDVYRTIDRFLYNTLNMKKSDLALEYNTDELTRLIRENTPVTGMIYNQIRKIIEEVKIRYILSEINIQK